MRKFPIERLREVLSYDPETGVFAWRYTGRRGKPAAGALAGSKDPRGYVQIRVDGKLYWAHRLAWAHVHGEWPSGEVDHMDSDKGNNRISNLRDGSKSLNMQNLRHPMRSNRSSGLLGAHWFKSANKWKSAITVDGRTRYIGLFDTPEAAHAAYVAAKRQLHAGCTL